MKNSLNRAKINYKNKLQKKIKLYNYRKKNKNSLKNILNLNKKGSFCNK